MNIRKDRDAHDALEHVSRQHAPVLSEQSRRKLGSSRNRPTGSAMPMTVDRPRIILVQPSEPNFASSHFSNLDGASSSFLIVKNAAE